MKNGAAITGDIVSFTALAESDKRELEDRIRQMISGLDIMFANDGFFGRIIKGDSIEFAMQKPKHALRIALMLKTFIKSYELTNTQAKDPRIKYFSEHGLRLAVAIAPLSTLDPEKGIIDGEAIYLSGRKIKNLSTYNKQKIIIKNTMFFCSPDQKTEEQFDTIFSLLDTILQKCSAKQSEVLYHKLSGLTEKEVSEKLGKNQSTISQHSNAAGWQTIEKTVNYFEKNIS